MTTVVVDIKTVGERMKTKFKSFIMGVIVSSLVFSAVAIYASGGTESAINVVLNKVKRRI